MSVTREACATHVDVAMSSCLWMSRAQLRALVKTLDTAEYPLLIHCAWGSERTGLVSAFAELLRPGATLDDARAQFSIRYLFVRVNDGKVMAEHLDQYENWLRARGIEHAPANFHRWVDEGFQPGQPSREDWPYDPYPLVVTARPGDKPQQQVPMAERSGSTSKRR
jgi:Tyrosine phosphatase family